jgi:hypothetical protein
MPTYKAPVEDLSSELEAKFGSRFTPPKLLIDMAAKGETFYVRFASKELAVASLTQLNASAAELGIAQ